MAKAGWTTVLAAAWLGACAAGGRADGLLGDRQQQVARQALAGQWGAEVGGQQVRLALHEDGRMELDGAPGRWRLEGGALMLGADGNELAYSFAFTQKGLQLSGGDLGSPLTFTRLRDPGGYLGWFFGVSREAALTALYRIVVVAAAVVACRVLLWLLRLLWRWVIYSEWGPLRLLYRRRKNRAMTIHSLALNVCKYVIYLVALGFVLTQLGVNYAAYLASLSVIGLAIGFGSQGLVQDMVTGFSIIFEGQFDVGDMVEIGGQTGVVEELGLRMTRLRNYAGQLVTIPNRNITTVGNYFKGAQRARMDVAVAGPDAARRAAERLDTLGGELARQFEGAILERPVVEGPLELATGEHFVRVRLGIWPGQQWVVDQQLVPRGKEALMAAGLEVPGDRVAVHYYARKERAAAPDWRAAIRKITGRIPGRKQNA